MKFLFWTKVVVCCAVVTASMYEPLRAMEDSTQAPKRQFKSTTISCISGRTIPSSLPVEFGQKLSQDFRGSIPTISFPSFALNPVHFIWSYDISPWISEASYTFAFSNVVSRDMTFRCLSHELSGGYGYAIVNTPRFRLYPMIIGKFLFDQLTFAKPTTFTNLVTTFEAPSFSLDRFMAFYEIAVGADYRFPTAYENYDIYVVAKVGYNLPFFDAPWSQNGSIVGDFSPTWFSRRGVFFQIGIGFGVNQTY